MDGNTLHVDDAVGQTGTSGDQVDGVGAAAWAWPGTGNAATSDNRGNSTGEITAPKKRGRKPKSESGSSAQTGAKLSVTGVEKILLGIHAMLYGVTGIPDLAITQEEARELAEATANVARHYEAVLTDKQIDISALITVIFAVYGQKIFAVILAIKEKKNAGNKNAQ